MSNEGLTPVAPVYEVRANGCLSAAQRCRIRRQNGDLETIMETPPVKALVRLP